MAAGKSGEIIIWGTNGCAIKLGWEEEYNISTNASQPKITSCEFRSATYYGTWYFDGNIQVNGQAVVYMTSNPFTHMTSSSGDWNDVTAVNLGTNPPWISDWINHNADGTLTIPITVHLAVWRTGTPTQRDTISGTQNIVLTTIPVPKTLTFSADTHSWVSVKKNGTPLASGDTVYYGDVLNITFGSAAGYKAAATLNGSPITTGINHTVTGDVSIAVTAEAQGLVYIDNGAGLEAYQVFIDNGSAFEQYAPYVDNGSAFELCS